MFEYWGVKVTFLEHWPKKCNSPIQSNSCEQQRKAHVWGLMKYIITGNTCLLKLVLLWCQLLGPAMVLAFLLCQLLVITLRRQPKWQRQLACHTHSSLTSATTVEDYCGSYNKRQLTVGSQLISLETGLWHQVPCSTLNPNSPLLSPLLSLLGSFVLATRIGSCCATVWPTSCVLSHLTYMLSVLS